MCTVGFPVPTCFAPTTAPQAPRTPPTEIAGGAWHLSAHRGSAQRAPQRPYLGLLGFPGAGQPGPNSTWLGFPCPTNGPRPWGLKAPIGAGQAETQLGWVLPGFCLSWLELKPRRISRVRGGPAGPNSELLCFACPEFPASEAIPPIFACETRSIYQVPS